MDIGDEKFSWSKEIDITFEIGCSKCGSDLFLENFYEKFILEKDKWYEFKCPQCHFKIVITQIKIK